MMLGVKPTPNYPAAELKAKYPHLPWRAIVAFRNVMAHAYFSVQLDITWETALTDMPAQRRQVAQIVADEYPDNSPAEF